MENLRDIVLALPRYHRILLNDCEILLIEKSQIEQGGLAVIDSNRKAAMNSVIDNLMHSMSIVKNIINEEKIN